ncbi:hypothetical protein CW304_26120 [Bacillus sp. UFRGS-B20]|nr:hypothetical protein CW304_26120 [Bacillus sp. UFRGS-B20]
MDPTPVNILKNNIRLFCKIHTKGNNMVTNKASKKRAFKIVRFSGYKKKTHRKIAYIFLENSGG